TVVKNHIRQQSDRHQFISRSVEQRFVVCVADFKCQLIQLHSVTSFLFFLISCCIFSSATFANDNISSTINTLTSLNNSISCGNTFNNLSDSMCFAIKYEFTTSRTVFSRNNE